MDHWAGHAQHWKYVRPPLRPSAQDIDYVANSIATNIKTSAPKILLLGVTPELAKINWQDDATLIAVDRNQEMISSVWPEKEVKINSTVIQGDWTALPINNDSCDLVIGDGCFTVLAGEEDYHSVLAEIRRVLKRESIYIMRFFIRPEITESPEMVINELHSGRISNFHIFKWQLAMAMVTSFSDSVKVKDVWEIWEAEGINADKLAVERNWELAEINTINVYENSSARYSFPTIKELYAVLDSYFNVTSVYFPNYEMGERCPIISLTTK